MTTDEIIKKIKLDGMVNVTILSSYELSRIHKEALKKGYSLELLLKDDEDYFIIEGEQ